MIFGVVRVWPTVEGACRLSGEVEVVQAGGAEHRVMDAVAPVPATPQDLPALRAGEDVLDADADLFVGGVVRLVPVGQLFALRRRGGITRPMPG